MHVAVETTSCGHTLYQDYFIPFSSFPASSILLSPSSSQQHDPTHRQGLPPKIACHQKRLKANNNIQTTPPSFHSTPEHLPEEVHHHLSHIPKSLEEPHKLSYVKAGSNLSYLHYPTSTPSTSSSQRPPIRADPMTEPVYIGASPVNASSRCCGITLLFAAAAALASMLYSFVFF